MGILDGLGKIWAFPNTAIGLVAGAACLVLGARLRLQHNALAFFDCPIGSGAVTLGNIILTTEPSLDLLVPAYLARHKSPEGRFSDCDFVHLGRHEEAHTYQYQVLGPAFLLVYWIAGIGRTVSALGHAADRYALTGAGWWPWGRLG